MQCIPRRFYLPTPHMITLQQYPPLCILNRGGVEGVAWLQCQELFGLSTIKRPPRAALSILRVLMDTNLYLKGTRIESYACKLFLSLLLF
jgi:hypothetical protein